MSTNPVTILSDWSTKKEYRTECELEEWCRHTGRSRFLAGNWEAGAAGFLSDLLMENYQQGLSVCYQHNAGKPGKLAAVWDYIPSEDAFVELSAEAFSYVLNRIDDGGPYYLIAGGLGSRLEYKLWRNHPLWGQSWHLKGISLAIADDTDMLCVMRSIANEKFGMTEGYKPMTKAERELLGAYFIECIADTTGLIEVTARPQGGKKLVRYVEPTSTYMDFLRNWKDSPMGYRPIYVPMIAPPRDYTDMVNGGYYSITTSCFKRDSSKFALKDWTHNQKLFDVINYLQSIPFKFDWPQIEIAKELWRYGHTVGKLPKREPMTKPVEWKYGSAKRFFTDFFKYKQDQRKNGDRTRFLNALITAEKLKDANRLWFVWFMDNRGRLYSRSGQINYIFSSLYRAMLKFDESSLIKGREREMAWAIGGAVGIEPDATARNDYLMECGGRIAEVGRDPLGCVPYWDTLKDPWKFIQLAKDWASYVDNEDARTSTPFQLDQTCSGFGHLACLTRDQRLAESVCVVGTERTDLYKIVSDLTESQVRMKLEEAIHTGDEHTEALARCWLGFWPDRSMFKAATMPVVYGRAYVTLSLIVGQYLRDELKHFKYGDLRIVELGNWLAAIIHLVTQDYLPGAGDLGRWLKACGEIQIAAGQAAHWITPNGLLVTCKEMIKTRKDYVLQTGARRVRLAQYVDDNATLNPRVKASRIAADFIHSMDATFCQNVVLRWKETGRPIVTVHDCFATTLEHVPALHELLLDEWHQFYQTDWLSAHRSMVMIETGAKVPEPPIIGDLALNDIGENPHLFS